MSRMTTFSKDKEIAEFARDAAECFSKDPNITTYSTTLPEAGGYLAIRWGMGEDCVLVVKMDEYFEPVNFQQAVKSYPEKRV